MHTGSHCNFCIMACLLFIYRCALYTCFYEANKDYYYYLLFITILINEVVPY